MTWLSQWLTYIKIRWMERLQYPWDFAFATTGMFIIDFIGPLFVLVFYNTGATIPGWTQWELILLQGIFSLISGIIFTLFWGMLYKTSSLVRNGTIEIFRIRPISTLRHLAMHCYNEQDTGQIFAGLIIIATAATQLDITTAGALQAALYAIPGFLFLTGFTILGAALHVYFTKIPRLAAIATDLITKYSKFPKEAFTTARHSLVSLSPLFLVNYYPTKALLKQPISPTNYAYSLLTGAGTLIIGLIYWHHALRTYDGAHG